MSSWNYRIMGFGYPENPHYAIHEVYYDEDEKLKSYSESAAVVFGDLGDEKNSMSWILDQMREAIDKPILMEDEFPKEAAQETT